MENKEQIIKMLITAIDNETKRVESIDDAINKVSGELSMLKEDYECKHSEAFSRYMKLCKALGSAKEYIENCQKQLDELSASDENDITNKAD